MILINWCKTIECNTGCVPHFLSCPLIQSKIQRICKCDLMGDQRLILHSFTEAFSKLLTYALSPSNNAEYPADTQRCDNVYVRSRRHATSTQHCSNVGVTTLKLQRYSSVASTFDNSFSSQYTLDVILKTLLLQRWNHNVKFTMSSQRHHIFNTYMMKSIQRWNQFFQRHC